MCPLEETWAALRHGLLLLLIHHSLYHNLKHIELGAFAVLGYSQATLRCGGRGTT